MDRNCKVPVVERVFPVPALRSEFPPLSHTGMEVAEWKENRLKFLLTGTLVKNVLYKRKQMNVSSSPPLLKETLCQGIDNTFLTAERTDLNDLTDRGQAQNICSFSL